MFSPYFDRVAARATADAHLVDVRRARREFQDRTGKFEEDEPWFEQRMTLFLEWFVLDRVGADGMIPVSRFVAEEGDQLSEDERAIYVGLSSTQRTLVRLDRWEEGRITLTDMIGGGAWSIRQQESMVGLQRGDLLDTRIIPFKDDLYLGRGMVFHPRVARDHILELLEDAHQSGALTFSLVDLLASMRLRFARYRNVKVRHVYRLPPGWSPS